MISIVPVDALSNDVTSITVRCAEPHIYLVSRDDIVCVNWGFTWANVTRFERNAYMPGSLHARGVISQKRCTWEILG